MRRLINLETLPTAYLADGQIARRELLSAIQAFSDVESTFRSIRTSSDLMRRFLCMDQLLPPCIFTTACPKPF